MVFLSIASDIDECSADSRPCDDNANCSNSEGSYSCICKQGFTGNGTVCEGKGESLFNFSKSILV